MIYLASLVEETKDKVEGYKIIHTKTELDRIVVDNLNSHKVIIRQDFAHEYFTPTGLVSYIDNVRRININIVIELDMTEQVLTKDVIVDKINDCRNLEELIDLAVFHDVEFLDTVKSLIKFYNANYQEMLNYSSQVSRLQAQIAELNDEIKEKDYMIHTESNNKLSYQSKFHALVSRINYQYDKGINKDKIFHVDRNSYDKVLYIKEYTRVQYTDTLVYYLKEILKTLYGMPTRILTIENYYADGKIPLYPNLKPHHNLIERDVIKGDILMLGMQPKLMENILKNSSNISILIILDRGGYSYPHVTGDNVETIYTFSDLKDKPGWIPNGRVISYEEDTLWIDYIKDFDTLDVAGKISKYSSMDVVKHIVQLLERK